jgi:hypothetical protein
MSRHKKITDVKEVAMGFANAAIFGGSPISWINCGSTQKTRSAIISSVCQGIIEHSGDPLNGWLTEKGISLLGPETEIKYRGAIRGKTMMRSG